MRLITMTPLPDFGYSHPIEDIILGIKQTTTRKTDKAYIIGQEYELAYSYIQNGRRYYARKGVVIRVEDVSLITPKDITEEYAIRDGIHPTKERTARENLLAILKHFYKHIPREMQCVEIKHVGYTDDFSELEWKEKVEKYRRKTHENPTRLPTRRG
jgi:hypothetical protein